MTTTLQRVGDQLALILEPAVLDELGLDENTEFLVTTEAEGIFLQPIRFAADADVDRLTGRIMVAHAETLRKLAL